MKKAATLTSERSRKLAFLTARLSGYSATAIASLLTAQAGHAAIHNITGFTLDGTATGPLILNFQGQSSLATHTVGIDGLGTFQLSVKNNSNTGAVYAMGNAHIMFSTGVANLPAGAAISGRNFNAARQVFALYSQRSSLRRGNFLPLGGATNSSGYLDFRAKVGSHTYVGWLHPGVEALERGNFADQVSLLAQDSNPRIFGAYELIGDVTPAFTNGTIASAPEPSISTLSGLDLLALGAAGVREMRRRRSAAGSGLILPTL
jgi:hypothetical protein